MDISCKTDGSGHSYHIYLSGEEIDILNGKGSLNGELNFGGSYYFNANLEVGSSRFSGIARPMPSVLETADKNFVAKFVMRKSVIEELLESPHVTSSLKTGDVTVWKTN